MNTGHGSDSNLDCGVQRAAFSVNEFCQSHGISRAMFYKLIKCGKGPAVMKVGARTLVSAKAAATWRGCLEEACAEGADG